MSAWRDKFLAGGEAHLKSRETHVDDGETQRLKRVVAEQAVSTGLLRERIRHMEGDALRSSAGWWSAGSAPDNRLLVVTDGAKGLHAAVAEVFGAAAVLQHCQWHKRENVVSYLPEKHPLALRRKLRAAHKHPTYEAASRALKQVRQALRLLNASALASLEEGLEETLTLHRLGVFRELGISLKTTTLLESIHAKVEARAQKVDTTLAIAPAQARALV